MVPLVDNPQDIPQERGGSYQQDHRVDDRERHADVLDLAQVFVAAAVNIVAELVSAAPQVDEVAQRAGRDATGGDDRASAAPQFYEGID